MNGFSKRVAGALLAGATLIAAPAARAEDAPASDFTVTASASLVSQYRFRGISLSDEDPAFQPSIGLSHSSGFYVGTWGSNLSGFGSFGGDNLEVDAYGGWKGKLGGLDFDGGVYGYFYPGTNGFDYFEVYGSLGTTLGPVAAKVGTYYAPNQSNTTDDSVYVYGDFAGGIPNTPFTLKAHVGYTDGFFSPGGNNYIDYSAGVDFVFLKNLTLNLSYVDTDIGGGRAATIDPGRNIVDSAILFSLTAAF